MSESRPHDETERCGSCGAERAWGGPPGGQDVQPIIHCEWCGAEYPVPEHWSPAKTASPRSGAPDRGRA
jgi:hypothetical protein